MVLEKVLAIDGLPQDVLTYRRERILAKIILEIGQEMKIFRIEISNYRLLEAVTIDLEDELSLVIGKNNTGKTSILSVLDKFLNNPDKFCFNDFNINLKEKIKKWIDEDVFSAETYPEISINLRIYIEYTETCNLDNISRFMMDLDPNNNFIVLGFEYTLPNNEYEILRKDYKEFKRREIAKKSEKEKSYEKMIYDFLNSTCSKYFKIKKKSIEINKDSLEINEDNFIDLVKENINIKDIINFQYISARRDVSNKDIDKTLSLQTSLIYAKVSNDDEEKVEELKDKLNETDEKLTESYAGLFSDVLKRVETFGGITPGETVIKIISKLEHQNLLKDNTTVVYKHDNDNELPESYNGLGYMNLIVVVQMRSDSYLLQKEVTVRSHLNYYS